MCGLTKQKLEAVGGCVFAFVSVFVSVSFLKNLSVLGAKVPPGKVQVIRNCARYAFEGWQEAVCGG